MLGVGGMQLYRAETPGPMKDEKLTPRLMHTARTLWLIYLALTVACATAYGLAGMSLFDAVAHSFSTVSTGGFSPHDASLAYFNSPTIEVIAEVFMVLGGINFGVHFMAWRARSPRQYLRSPEVRTYLTLLAVATGVVSLLLTIGDENLDFIDALRDAAFQVVSIMTSTGFTTADYPAWPLSLPVLLIFISFIGGCAGSTAGGMKVIRIMLLGKQALRELRRLIHPRAVLLIKIGGRTLPERLTAAVWGYFSVYVATFVVLMLLMMFTGADQVTAFSAVATSMNNLGPGLGEVSYNFHDMSQSAKLISAIAMLLGRLEIFTLLVLLNPEFWRN